MINLHSAKISEHTSIIAKEKKIRLVLKLFQKRFAKRFRKSKKLYYRKSVDEN